MYVYRISRLYFTKFYIFITISRYITNLNKLSYLNFSKINWYSLKKNFIGLQWKISLKKTWLIESFQFFQFFCLNSSLRVLKSLIFFCVICTYFRFLCLFRKTKHICILTIRWFFLLWIKNISLIFCLVSDITFLKCHKN